jgi:hypothetical protein
VFLIISSTSDYYFLVGLQPTGLCNGDREISLLVGTAFINISQINFNIENFVKAPGPEETG